MTYDKAALLCLGMEDVARWRLENERLQHEGEKRANWRRLTAKPGMLFAFCCGKKVMFIGRADSTLSKHFCAICEFIGPYARLSQQILQTIRRGKEVRILVLAYPPPIAWGGFQISLASGLQQSLTEAFRPNWNQGTQ